jgi:hypothetical protein
MTRSVIWLWVQLGVLLLFAYAGREVARDSVPNPPWLVLPFIFLYTALLTPWSLRLGRRRRPHYNWSAPSWFGRPFDGPLQTFFLGSRSFIATGIVGCLVSLFQSTNVFLPLFILSFGLGIYVGMWWFFRSTDRSRRVANT